MFQIDMLKSDSGRRTNARLSSTFAGNVWRATVFFLFFLPIFLSFVRSFRLEIFEEISSVCVGKCKCSLTVYYIFIINFRLAIPSPCFAKPFENWSKLIALPCESRRSFINLVKWIIHYVKLIKSLQQSSQLKMVTTIRSRPSQMTPARKWNASNNENCFHNMFIIA